MSFSSTFEEMHPLTTVGRFAPTPSGRMHAGNVFALLMAWLAARHENGRVILRIEDLDPRAQDPQAAKLLMDDLSWLGLTWDEGPYYQSQRGEAYASALETLRKRNLLYPCFCTRSQLHAATAPHLSDGTYVYPGTCRNLTPAEVRKKSEVRDPATRVRVPNQGDSHGSIWFDDVVYGRQHEDLARDCGDFLVRRSDGVIAYQLAVVVDDGLMGVTQVVRGHDLLGSVPRQIYLQRLLGFPQPTYAHVPLLMASDGRRLSKRDRDLDLGVLRERMAGPQRLLGKLASTVGLAQPGEEVTADQLVERFSWQAIRDHKDDIVVNDEFIQKDLL